DAAQWCQLADASIARLSARGVTPVVCGGTFLWVKALLYGLAEAPAGDTSLRERHRQLAQSQGREALHRELGRVDPKSAARLNPNDLMRVSRALEVFELTGEPMSALQERPGSQAPRYRARLCGVAQARAASAARIRERTRRMFQAGWVDEVRSLLERGYGESRPMRSVGYRQIADALTTSQGPLDLSELEESVYRATRVFARRQRTWLRDQPVHWLAAELAQQSANNSALLEALERA